MDYANCTADELEESAEKKEMFVWYYDKYLPAAVGKTYYGPKIRYYTTYVSERSFGKATTICCSRPGEAFGLLQYANGLEKWRKMAEEEKSGVKSNLSNEETRGKYTKIPKTDEEKAQMLSGFTKEGQDLFKELIKKIKAEREQDAGAGHVKAKLVLKVLKETQKIPENVTAPEIKSRKRKASPKAENDFDYELFEEV